MSRAEYMSRSKRDGGWRQVILDSPDLDAGGPGVNCATFGLGNNKLRKVTV